ncbi:MAG: CHASE2 domain-containing protein [Candidatus Omnitrophica bacterium]|nr:CHASE2 domain-containing protein [Candidatus Omnitrophota bacterium]
MEFKKAAGLSHYLILPIAVLSILLISCLRLTDNYELETLDLRFRLRPAPAVTDKVALIEIGDDTLKNFGQWPIARSYHALLIRALSESGAKSIIFDIFFPEAQEGDDDLESAIRDAKNVYLPFVFELNPDKRTDFASATGYAAKNLLRFSLADKGEGHINIFPDIDGKFRRVPLLVNYGGNWYPYISYLATCDYLDMPVKDAVISPGRHISSGSLKIPLDDSSNMLINFSGKWGKTYKHYSYFDIVQSFVAPAIGQKPILDLKLFKDKVCVVGLTAAGTVDLHPNPFETLYPGFGIHAEVFNSLLSGRFISRASKGINLLIMAMLSIMIAIATLKTKPIKGLLILILLELFFWMSSILVFNIWGIWIDLFYPAAIMILLYMSLTLHKYISEWKKRLLLENELNIAKKIQESFLSKSIPEVEGLRIESAMFTAHQVGGDLYDFRDFGGGSLGVMIGDVSGKGVPASLFMAMVVSEFKYFAAAGVLPENVLSGLNAKLVKESSSGLFVTMFYMVFDMKKKKLRFSSGGHLPAIHLNHLGEVKLLDVPDGMPLGLVDSYYSSGELSFDKGDIFVLYTDGVTEAMNARRELYGAERLIRAVTLSKGLPPDKMLNAMEKDLRRFEPKSRQHDDITFIIVKVI